MKQTENFASLIQPYSRRTMLQQMCLGFGGLALQGMMPRPVRASAAGATGSPMAPRQPHFRSRAKRVIFLFMHGGPSHVDLFDYKPRLYKDHDKPLPFKEREVQFANRANIMKPPWGFRQVGASGHWMSELWEHLPGVSDELCMINSVCETNVAHGGACMKIHCGDEAFLRPSMGAWVSYGLGTETENLPGFITICPTTLHGGVNNFGAAFLPSIHQGVSLGTPGYPNTLAKNARFNYMTNDSLSPRQQKLQLELLRKLHERNQLNSTINEAMEARIQSFELAFRMQTEAPEVTDLSGESEITRKLYGMDNSNTENFGHMCLLARRFAEKGVRFIQVSHAHSLPFNNEQWDQHSHLEKGHSMNVRQIDKPITGLIRDLKRLGMLEDTLVLWGGEFGRTPTAQAGSGERGRDHHPDGFTVWMAGGGVRGGFRYGATDEYGYNAIEDRCTIHDLHATLLHILGLDHTQLTFPHEGRDYRLTDIYGEAATKILA
jgi:hypothetical protein|tara:strand:- start:94 stop:1566 length:1473 start_codon:yes stop_codon:yes gene_type:complete